MDEVRIGIIGGSGLYQMAGLENKQELSIETPFGSPSDQVIIGELGGQKVAFLPRHGRGHRINPTEVNSRANIYALKTLGVKYIISVSACGSLRDDYAPRHIVIPDQIFDRTRGRQLSFFEKGLVVHISFADPFSPELSKMLLQAVQATSAPVHEGGLFVVIEGPRFSTKGESNIFRKLGCDIIGMTAVPEAQLAREAEIAYATMAHVTDYDVWHEVEGTVTVDAVVRNLLANVEVAQQAIRNIVPMLKDEPDMAAHHALKDAIITDRAAISDEVKKRYKLLIGHRL